MIIGISGYQSSGKDTVADYLVKEYGFVKLSFASALKDIVAIIFGWSREKLEGLTVEDRKWREEIDEKWAKTLSIPILTPRYVLQHLGTEVFRNHFHPDIWTKIIENQLFLYRNVVISDCRFVNEIEMIKNNGGQIIQVHRDSLGVIENANMHRSESEWIHCHCDWIIKNDGTIEELHKQIYKIMWCLV